MIVSNSLVFDHLSEIDVFDVILYRQGSFSFHAVQLCTVEALLCVGSKVGIALAGLLLFLVLMVWIPASSVGASERMSEPAMPVTGTVQTTPTEDATVTALNKEKLQHESDWWWSNGATILTSLFSTLTFAVAGLITVVRYFNDRRDAREKQEQDAKRLVEERKAERDRRDEERLQNAIAGLGSERIEARAIAASMLLTFLEQPDYERFYQQIFKLAVTNLRQRHVDPSTPEPLDSLSLALITVFIESFPLARKVLKKESQFDPFRLDASGIQLDNAYLSFTDLEGIRMRQASLRGTHFWKTNLNGAYLKWSDLRGADLAEAHLEKADLGETKLAGADLSKAYLAGARIVNADLTGAYLIGADLTGANLTNTNPLLAKSLKNAIMLNIIGLNQAQKNDCAAAEAIIDNSNQPPTPSTSSSSLPTSSSQSTSP
jgi:uncharacterized protein YjbI with pentapeptide repeats